MELIADGGSTKVDWVLLDGDKKEKRRITSIGINPAIVTHEELVNRIFAIDEIVSVKDKIKKVSFYGAGCGTEKPKALLTSVFNDVFTNAIVFVAEDMLGAVYAASFNSESIVCILGTGSNSCYYNGEEIQDTIPSLGYIVMDEASGNYFGKILLQDFFYNKMPKEIRNDFEIKFDLDPDTIKGFLYKSPNPNRYLATFAKFMFDYKEHSYIKTIIRNGFNTFIENRVLCYSKSNELPIYFIGSIAYYFKELLEETAQLHNLKIDGIIQKPLDNLIAYHRNLS